MKYLHFILFFLFLSPLFAHNNFENPPILRNWHVQNQAQGVVSASFMLLKNDVVLLENAAGDVLKIPFRDLSTEDQRYVNQRVEKVQKLNNTRSEAPILRGQSNNWLWLTLVVLALSALTFRLFRRQNPENRLAWTGLSGVFAVILFSFLPKPPTTDPKVIDAAFKPFKPNVYTRWDATYFYVESKGIPTTHLMMTGITSWQQQVPIPQCYTGNNAWSIPLNPVIAATPVPVNQMHFLRGAVAVAVNGIPIFNPYTNTGIDAFLDGQLDNWGGHSGRADDYHYHIAPLHLYNFTDKKLPVAYALDGFPIFGSVEPDGTPMQTLDANHGHFGTDGVYHYHGTAAAPYMIGKMVGRVTEDTTLQIVPQASASPVRPSTTPLRGATITNFAVNGTNGYNLTYTLNNQTYNVNYSWTNNGSYTYNFVNPTGTTTSTYNGFRPCQIPTATSDLWADENAVVLFPNPTKGGFALQINAPLNIPDVQDVSVFDAQGRLVFRTEGYQPRVNPGLAAGSYWVKVQFKATYLVKKLVVQ